MVLVCQNEKCKAEYCKECVIGMSDPEEARLIAFNYGVPTPELMVCWFCKKKVVSELWV